MLGEGLTLKEKQYTFTDGSRLDLLLYDAGTDQVIVVEIKKGHVGREALTQIKHYMKWCKQELGYSKIKGIIVCPGILPYFESELLAAKTDNVFVRTYGWRLDINGGTTGG